MRTAVNSSDSIMRDILSRTGEVSNRIMQFCYDYEIATLPSEARDDPLRGWIAALGTLARNDTFIRHCEAAGRSNLAFIDSP
jgi:hypothetical protein